MNKGSNQEFIDGTLAQTTVVVPFIVLSCVLMSFTAVKTLCWLLRRFLCFMWRQKWVQEALGHIECLNDNNFRRILGHLVAHNFFKVSLHLRHQVRPLRQYIL
ncbi:hypothetical protein AeMF1_004586 [Aphanomyces euteiches]|nr:hypothetical protein AeMF1_004586 [Aphanomyces euteiches]